MSTPLDVLIDEGSKLFNILRDAKKKEAKTSPKTAEEVKAIVTNVLNILRKAPPNSIQESRDKLVIKIGAMLDEFIKCDSKNKPDYESLNEEVASFLTQKQASDAASSQPGDSADAVISHPEIDGPEEHDYESAFEKLPNNEKKGLSYFLLFPAETELKKREIIHCWVGMDLTDDKGSDVFMSWERLLAKFVAMGFIDRTFQNKKLLNRYKMPKSVHSSLSGQQTNDQLHSNLPGLQPNAPIHSGMSGQPSNAEFQSNPSAPPSNYPVHSNPPAQESSPLVASSPSAQPMVELGHSNRSGQQPNKLAHAKENDMTWSVLCHEKQGNKSKNESKKRSMIRSMTMQPLRGTDDHQKVGKNETPLIRRGSLRMRMSPDADGYDDPEALLNVSQTTINAARLKTISEMDKLKVVHLGSWRQNSSKYIVLEDIDAFKHLKSLSKTARFLSLGGVSGMVDLPELVYELKLLKVLDLRACNNLETLPDGIKSLLNLTHLDLSGCYLLDHVPFGITFLTKLRVLKGFVINTDDIHKKDGKGKRERKEKQKEKEKENEGEGEEGKGKKEGKGIASSSPCPFEQISKLKELRKLTIITRRMSFPTTKDIETFSELVHLSCLRITWVINSSTEVPVEEGECTKTFPPSLTKLELQAASHDTAARLLHSISENKTNCGLEKLYIRGGSLRELKDEFSQPTVVRLRYLPELQIDWDDFKKLFPNLDRLEILECPNLILFPCDENGVWEQSQSVLDDKVDEQDDKNKWIPNHENGSFTGMEEA